MVCSLTRTAASEIKSRHLPIKDEQVGTLHGHAYRALKKPIIAETRIVDWNEENPDLQLLVRNHDPNDCSTEQNEKNNGDVLYDAYQLLRNQMVPRDTWPYRVQWFAQRWEKWKDNSDFVDFTDMIERALREVS